MQYRQLGSSDLRVSEISLGSWLTYGVGVEADKAKACLDRAFDLGINLIDTANVYGRGAAETVLGEQLAGRPRDSYVLATKLWGDMGDGDKGLSRAQVLQADRRLAAAAATDYVDLYQCHRYDPVDAAGRDDAGALGDRARGQGALDRLFRMVARADRGGAWPCRGLRSSSPASRSIPCFIAGRKRR